VDAADLNVPSARLHVDLGALGANYAQLVRVAAPNSVAAVVKADAYGLGLIPIASRLAERGCKAFFVTTVDEGVRLRNAVRGVKIFVLQGAVCAPDQCERASLIPVLSTLQDVREWAAVGTAIPTALQVDTGITRAGLGQTDIVQLLSDTSACAALNICLLLTHLACADEPEHPLNAQQVARFKDISAHFPNVQTSIGNSAGLFLGPDFQGDLARPGIALYGGQPFAERRVALQDVVRLEARVLQVRDVPAGVCVGYGASWQARTPSRIATLDLGYADGYPRSLGNKGFAVAAGQRLPVVGRISMDMTTIDITALEGPSLRQGDYVDLLGGGVPIEEAARLAGTLHYELLTGLAARLTRVWHG